MRRIGTAIAFLCVAVFVLAAAVGCGSSNKPNIESLNPATGPAGTQVVISGKKFGTTQGTGVVHIGEKVAGVVAWTDIDVTVTVPSGLAEAPQGVSIITAQGESNQVNFTVTKGAAKQPDRKPGEIESNTPAQAMAAFLKKNGTDPTGYTYSVVKLSAIDPNWKIDRADKGQKTTYFLLKKVNGLWTVADDGSALTPDELKGEGAPSDLWIQVPAQPPRPPQNQVQVIQSYLASKGMDISGVAINFVKESTTDGNWELFQVVFPPERQMPNQYVVLHLENNAWVVKNYGSAAVIDATPGVPADLKI